MRAAIKLILTRWLFIAVGKGAPAVNHADLTLRNNNNPLAVLSALTATGGSWPGDLREILTVTSTLLFQRRGCGHNWGMTSFREQFIKAISLPKHLTCYFVVLQTSSPFGSGKTSPYYSGRPPCRRCCFSRRTPGGVEVGEGVGSSTSSYNSVPSHRGLSPVPPHSTPNDHFPFSRRVASTTSIATAPT